MKEELEKKLFEKYPKIFIGKDKSITESLMPFGFDCGDGWFWLVDKLCQAIQNYVDARNDGVRIRNKARQEGRCLGRGFEILSGEVEEEWQVEAVQVKEKFGSLRYYISGGDGHVSGMISFAEHLSCHICEICGSTEDVNQYSTGWIKTLCAKCHEKKL